MSDAELQMTISYPDITPLLAAKQRRRQELAAVSWEEKVAIVDKMRRLLPRHQWRRPDALPANTSNPDRIREDQQEGVQETDSREVVTTTTTLNYDYTRISRNVSIFGEKSLRRKRLMFAVIVYAKSRYNFVAK